MRRGAGVGGVFPVVFGRLAATTATNAFLPQGFFLLSVQALQLLLLLQLFPPPFLLCLGLYLAKSFTLLPACGHMDGC